MPQYRVYLLSPLNAILAREDFAASDDATARDIANEVCNSCSDMCSGYMLWSDDRRVIEDPYAMPRDVVPATRSREAQATVLKLEVALQKSGWRIAQSCKLAHAARKRREHGGPGSARAFSEGA